MSAADIVDALPGLVIVGLAPGFALISLLVPSWRWWQRLAAAPGLSAGMAGVVGLGMHDTRVPFRPATVLPVYVFVLLVVAVVRHRRRRRTPRPSGTLTRRQELLIVGAALAAGMATTITAGISLHDRVVPYGGDTPVHAEVANAIARTNDVLPTLPSPVEQSAWR